MNILDTDASQIAQYQAQWTQRWHEAATPPLTEAPWIFIEENHRYNFDLWHEEDIARRDDLGAERVRSAKRVIDRCNQARNDAMEHIDFWLARMLAQAGIDASQAPMHSETPGMMIDRLSILALKSYHMAEEAQRASAESEHRVRCAAKVQVLEEQRSDLTRCLDSLLAHIEAGERRFKLYKQFKMYNDAALNPQLYSTAQG